MPLIIISEQLNGIKVTECLIHRSRLQMLIPLIFFFCTAHSVSTSSIVTPM